MSVFFLICSAQVYLSVCQVIYFIAQLAGLANIKSSSFCVYSCIYVNLYMKSGITLETYELYLVGFNLRKFSNVLLKEPWYFPLNEERRIFLFSYILESEFLSNLNIRM